MSYIIIYSNLHAYCVVHAFDLLYVKSFSNGIRNMKKRVKHICHTMSFIENVSTIII